MEFIKINKKINYAILQMDRGKSNPINQQFVDEFIEALNQLLLDEKVLGIVITGKENFFSAGLDIPELYSYDEAQFDVFWKKFLQMILQLSKFNKPMVAAITGHAPAGGCIIANGCDYRVMADGNYKIGLNEIPVGIVVPKGVYAQYSMWIGTRNAYQYLMEGKLYSPKHAQEIGLIDEVVPLENVLERAEAKLKQYLQYEQSGWRLTKTQLRQSVVDTMESLTDKEMIMFQKQWWSEPVRSILGAFIDKLKK
ncbi:MAG: enoyl-CoA hydratase/isomerase family protein [Chitinophagales bacterium]